MQDFKFNQPIILPGHTKDAKPLNIDRQAWKRYHLGLLHGMGRETAFLMGRAPSRSVSIEDLKKTLGVNWKAMPKYYDTYKGGRKPSRPFRWGMYEDTHKGGIMFRLIDWLTGGKISSLQRQICSLHKEQENQRSHLQQQVYDLQIQINRRFTENKLLRAYLQLKVVTVDGMDMLVDKKVNAKKIIKNL